MADLKVDAKTRTLVVTCDCGTVHTVKGDGTDFTIETVEPENPQPPKKETPHASDPNEKSEGNIFDNVFRPNAKG